ncbi:MAG: hypothetical protein WCL37_04455 [Chrysiogenales bacterium]
MEKDSLKTDFNLEGRLIDMSPADHGATHTQDEWIGYFNDRNELMISMPVLYLAAKSNNLELLDSLKEDFNDRSFILSTRIYYDKGKKARIIHNYGSKLVKPDEHKVIIPDFSYVSVKDVLKTKEGLRYLQVLFGTKDNAQQIQETLMRLRNCDIKTVCVKTYGLKYRPDKAACCVEEFLDLNFEISDCSSSDYYGRSRGVHINTAGETQKSRLEKN